ncbi:hypothetical protein ACPB9J_31655 [Streptomyces lavendulocolor]|uniref:hypothetical protein n=1 Tax=Streptomyces lavendulocolor TaxID=67316 RepID=UPI003C2B9D6A
MTQTRRASNQHRPAVSRPGPRGLRFGMVAFCVIRDPDPGLNKGKAKALYSLLVSYSDVTTRNTDQGYPYRSTLADALDCTKDTVDNARSTWSREIGLIRVVRRKVDGKPDENDANAYQVYDQWLIQGCSPTPDTPPQLVARYGPTIPGFDVDAWMAEYAPSFDLAGWRAAYEPTVAEQGARRAAQRQKEAKRRKARKTGGSGTDSATPEEGETEGGSGTGSATGGGMCAALSRTGGPEPSLPDERAPFGGVAPNGRRRPPTGSRSAGEGGSAASGKTSPPSRSADTSSKGSPAPAKLTADERKVRAAVLELLPADFREALGPVIPTNIGRAVIDALGAGTPRERTPRELVEYRFLPRWRGYWAARFYAGELTPELGGGKRKRPFGPLTQMLADTAECGNLWCEDRHDFVTGTACTQCGMRKIDQRADRQPSQEKPAVSEPSSTVPRQAVAPMQCCDHCDRGFRSHTPGLCRDCELELVGT